MSDVLIFVQDGIGGAERITAAIANDLFTRGISVKVVLLQINSAYSITDFLNSGVEVVKIRYSSISVVFSFIKLINKERPKYIFSSVLNINNKILLTRVLFPKTKYIIRCDTNLTAYSHTQRLFINVLYPFASTLIAQTEEMALQLKESTFCSPSRISVIHNPLDFTNINKLISGVTDPFQNESNKHFIAVGRFDRAKGYEIMVEAFAILKTRLTNIDLHIIGGVDSGEGSIYATVKQIIKQNELENFVEIVGYDSNPYKYMKYADCFILSSRWEGLPNALIESQYLGIPAAATNCIPIISRIIKTGYNGFIAEVDNPKSLADAMMKAVNLGKINMTYKPSDICEFSYLLGVKKL